MDKARISSFILGAYWLGWRRWLAWSIFGSVIFLLGAARSVTDADFAFASMALLPVLVIAWVGGKRNGLIAASLAAAMWTVADVVSDRQFSSLWIPWTNAVTRWMTYSLVAFLVAQVRLQLEREHKHASRDVLTGLHNRRAFLEAGAAEVERSKRYSHPLAVTFLDLDKFKQINDSKGHDAGDAALRAVARALFGSMRSGDHVARLGGDEFAVLLPEISDEAAAETGRKISMAVNAALEAFPPVKGSVGVAWFETADRLFPEMLKAADELMYEVKQSGAADMRLRRFAAPK